LHIEDDGDGIVLTLQKDKTLGSNRATFSHLNGALSRRGSQPDYFDGTVQATFPGDRGTYKGKTIGHLKNPTTLELKVTLEVPMRIKGKTTSATRYRSCTLTKEDSSACALARFHDHGGTHRSLDIILTYYHVSEDELLDAVEGVNFDALLSDVNEEKKEEEK
jgi:hypothetical protein